MARVKKTDSSGPRSKMRPALSAEARENQLIDLAIDVAEKQLREGTASSQVITHYLKLGSSKERLERERLEEENKLLRAKTKALENQETSQELYREALKAFAKYSGHNDYEDEYDEY